MKRGGGITKEINVKITLLLPKLITVIAKVPSPNVGS